MDARIAMVAAAQHGLVSRAQLVVEGVGRPSIDGLVRRGSLERVARGVYAVPGAPSSPRRDVMAAVLRAGPGTRAVGERMLAAAGVRDARPTGPVHLLVAPGRRLGELGLPWMHDPAPGLGTPATIDGVPSYGVARNLIEAAATVAPDGDDEVRRLADGVRWTGRARMAVVERLVTSAPRHVGGRRLLMVGCLDVDAAESRPERVLEVVLAPFQPERQVCVLPDVRADFLLRRLMVDVEFDGPHHDSGHARLRDHARDQRVLGSTGIATVRVRREHLRDPAALLGRILAVAPGTAPR